MHSSSFSSAENRRFVPKLLILAVIAFFVFAASQHALASHKKPKPYALLYGTMWGRDNRPLPGILIHIRRAKDKRARWSLYSDASGEFAQRVPVGTMDYVVWAEVKEKHQKAKRVETSVHVDYDERVDFGLHLTE